MRLFNGILKYFSSSIFETIFTKEKRDMKEKRKEQEERMDETKKAKQPSHDTESASDGESLEKGSAQTEQDVEDDAVVVLTASKRTGKVELLTAENCDIDDLQRITRAIQSDGIVVSGAEYEEDETDE